MAVDKRSYCEARKHPLFRALLGVPGSRWSKVSLYSKKVAFFRTTFGCPIGACQNQVSSSAVKFKVGRGGGPFKTTFWYSMGCSQNQVLLLGKKTSSTKTSSGCPVSRSSLQALL